MKDQARRLAQLEDMLREAQLHPVARRRCNDGEAPASADLERQLSSVTQELQVRVRFCTASNIPGWRPQQRWSLLKWHEVAHHPAVVEIAHMDLEPDAEHWESRALL